MTRYARVVVGCVAVLGLATAWPAAQSAEPAAQAEVKTASNGKKILSVDDYTKWRSISGEALSPDGSLAAAITAEPPQLLLYPTGAGEPARLDRGPLDRITSASWFPDGASLFVCGAEASRAPRCYTQRMSGTPTPVTAEGVVGSLAPDGCEP